MFWEKSYFCGGNCNLPHKTLKFKGSVFSIFVGFFSIFGTKRKHTGLNNSEYAKEFLRIIVLEEKLDLCWKLKFAAKTLKIKGSVPCFR